MKYKLSVIIPSLNEEWLGETIKDVLAHSSEETEIIVVLDGWKPDYELPKSDRLKVIALEKTIGQRKAQNLAIKASTAKFVAKLDAHVSLSDNWDEVMLKIIEANPNIVLVPAFTNLWVYNWVCPQGHKTYQGKVDKCSQCEETSLTKELVWRNNTKIYSDFRFNKDLIFEYGDVENYEMFHSVDAIQGSGFMVSRSNYWRWRLCDESWGSWGSQGYEIWKKTQDNGGRVFCTRKAFMGHFFRKADEFPYERDQKQIDGAYLKAKELAKK